MDPTIALNLACNAFQLCDVAWKLVSGSRKILQSIHGTSEQSQILEAVADDVCQLSNSMLLNDDYPESLQRLGRLSQRVASDLLDLISTLKVKGKHKRLESIMIAIKEIWKHDKLQSFVGLLQQLQSETTAHIQFLMLDKQSQLNKELLVMKSTAQGFEIQMDMKIDKLSRTLIQDLRQLKSQCAINVSKSNHRWPAMEIDTLSLQIDNATGSMKELGSELKNTTSLLRILKSLHFPRFYARHTQIPKAHAKTFEWIFVDRESNREDMSTVKFKHWLEKGKGTFWIRGKAGSGKSTLMKYLYEQPQTRSLLQTWADSEKLLIGKYFFWAAGTQLQKSREGLLRSILFDVLHKCPDLSQDVGDIVDARLEMNMDSDDVWDLDTLQCACSRVFSSKLSAKICLFIDGLDEFDGASEELVEVIKPLSHCDVVKICIASRPWTEFADAFSEDPQRLIRLEELTYPDIATFVHDTLSGNAKFSKLARKNNAAYELEEEIVQRSQGVFLWVHLVVRSLLEGAKYADNIDFLRKRLNAFPRDLDGFFHHMLNDIPEIYRQRTAKIFKYAFVAPVPMPAFVYHFLDQIEDKPNFALEGPEHKLKSEDVREILNVLENRLDGWTKGLLEVVRGAPYTVEFLHRTVRDFLLSSTQVQRMFQESLPPNFYASEMLCHGILAYIKYGPPSPKLLTLDNCLPQHLFHFANLFRKEFGTSIPLHLVLDQLHYKICGRGCSFIEICEHASQAGLPEYVAEKMECLHKEGTRMRRSMNDTCTTLLASALRASQYHPTMIKNLVDNGADPNAGSEESPLWTLAVDRMISRINNSPNGRSDAVEVLNILIGAVPVLRLPEGKNNSGRRERAWNGLRILLPLERVIQACQT